MIDTTDKAGEVARSAIRNAKPIERMRETLEHSEQMRDLALSRLRALYPESTTLELAELLIGARLIPMDSATRRL